MKKKTQKNHRQKLRIELWGALKVKWFHSQNNFHHSNQNKTTKAQRTQYEIDRYSISLHWSYSRQVQYKCIYLISALLRSITCCNMCLCVSSSFSGKKIKIKSQTLCNNFYGYDLSFIGMHSNMFSHMHLYSHFGMPLFI